MRFFHAIDVERLLKIKGKRGYGISLAVVKGDEIETYCSGSGRYGQDFPVNPDMLFQAGSISKPMFALTLLRYVDKGLIDLDADISGILSDFVKKPPMTFPALLSHTAGYSVGGFMGYRADAPLLSLEDVIAGRGNSKKVVKIKPTESSTDILAVALRWLSLPLRDLREHHSGMLFRKKSPSLYA